MIAFDHRVISHRHYSLQTQIKARLSSAVACLCLLHKHSNEIIEKERTREAEQRSNCLTLHKEFFYLLLLLLCAQCAYIWADNFRQKSSWRFFVFFSVYKQILLKIARKIDKTFVLDSFWSCNMPFFSLSNTQNIVIKMRFFFIVKFLIWF